jgi:hypothetical protein
MTEEERERLDTLTEGLRNTVMQFETLGKIVLECSISMRELLQEIEASQE